MKNQRLKITNLRRGKHQNFNCFKGVSEGFKQSLYPLKTDLPPTTESQTALARKKGGNPLVQGLLFLVFTWFSLSIFAQEGIIESLKFKDADIKVVLEAISQKAIRDGKKVNILVNPDVQGTVTVELDNTDWQTALEAVLKIYGYGYEWIGKNIILVDTLQNLAEKRKKLQESKVTEPVETRIFNLNFAKVEEVRSSIEKMLTPRGKLTYDKRTNTLVITDTPSNLAILEKTIASLDEVTPQVSIEAKIIETSLTKEENLGIKWNLKVGGRGSKRPTTFPFTEAIKGRGTKMFPKVKVPSELERVAVRDYDKEGNPVITYEEKTWHRLVSGFPQVSPGEFLFGTLDFSQLQVVLEALAHRSGTEIISNPKITTLNNHPAFIHIGNEWPIPKYTYNKDQGKWEITGFEYKPIGVQLKVTPSINKQGYITMLVTPEVKEIVRETSFGGNTFLPVTYTQSASTKVIVKDGETLVIGGLIKNKKEKIVHKLPILGDIPILGLFFKYKGTQNKKKDLLIFITPRLITNKKIN